MYFAVGVGLNQESLFNFVIVLWTSLGIFDFRYIIITDLLISKLPILFEELHLLITVWFFLFPFIPVF